MFENKKTKNGIHYSRYIASWINACKELKVSIYFDDKFLRWLEFSERLDEEEINNIRNMAKNGKMELEDSAKSFLRDTAMP